MQAVQLVYRSLQWALKTHHHPQSLRTLWRFEWEMFSIGWGIWTLQLAVLSLEDSGRLSKSMETVTESSWLCPHLQVTLSALCWSLKMGSLSFSLSFSLTIADRPSGNANQNKTSSLMLSLVKIVYPSNRKTVNTDVLDHLVLNLNFIYQPLLVNPADRYNYFWVCLWGCLKKEQHLNQQACEEDSSSTNAGGPGQAEAETISPLSWSFAGHLPCIRTLCFKAFGLGLS